MKNNLQAKSGIYKITINDYYIYIGQSRDIKQRWKQHLSELKQNKKSYNKQYIKHNKKEIYSKGRCYYKKNRERLILYTKNYIKDHIKEYKQYIKQCHRQKGILSHSERRKLQFEKRYNLSRSLTNKEWDTWRNTKTNQKPYAIKFLKTLPDLTFVIE